jgi:hypothetical protein
MVIGSVPRLWPGETVVCLGSGPSLTREDVASCRGRARVIAIKDSVTLAPWADVLYGCGRDSGGWWAKNGPRLADFAGLRFTLDPKAAAWATVLRETGMTGLETDPSGLRTGKNSGFQAINLAVHLGARRIVLLGYDLQRTGGRERWFGSHPWQTRSWSELGLAMIPLFETLVSPLAALGITIINASRETALACFPRQPLAEALA